MDEIIKNNSEGKSSLDGEHSEELSRLRATLTSLKKANPDTYGWIKVEGTNIDYPVVKRGDNEYYLDHAYTGEYLPVGAIFADFRTSDTFSENLNLVIYGHNVNTGSMFGSLKEFLNKDVFYNNRITVYTMDGIFTYRPFCIHETPYDSGFINTAFESWDGYVGFLNELAADSKIKAPDGVTLNENTRILTLSTCTNGAADNRLALHAVLESSVTD
jgi:sortase B